MSEASNTASVAAPWAAALLLLGIVLGVQQAARPDLTVAAPPDYPTARRVVFVSIDTLRQDHLSLYGYPRPTSPRLSEFAAAAAVFDNAMSHAPYTLPSHMSMFTGLHPRAHGVREMQDRLAPCYQTLAETLQSAGFRTAAFTDGGLMRGLYGFDQGFELYDDQRVPGTAEVNGFRRYGERVREWIARHRDDPFFLFVHTFDTHGPYYVEDEYRQALAGTAPVVPAQADANGDPIEYMRQVPIHDYLHPEQYDSIDAVVDHYDATIRFADDQVGGLLDYLASLDLLDDALVVITSDHGEVFLDRGLYVGHGLTLHEEEVRVPLVVKFPRGRYAGQRCRDVVRLIDLYPTVCAAAGVSHPRVQGVDLVDALTGADAEPRVAAGVSPNLSVRDAAFEDDTAYLRLRDQKYIAAPSLPFSDLVQRHLYHGGPDQPDYDCDVDSLGFRDRIPYHNRLFDLGADPVEQTDLAGAESASTRQGQTRMEQIRRRLAALEEDNFGMRCVRDGPGRATTDEDIARLIELGYLSASQAAAQRAARDDHGRSGAGSR